MGYGNFEKKSLPQLAKHIRAVSKNTALVFITVHAKTRMTQRRVSDQEIYACLQMGSISRPPEPNEAMGTLECRMERYIAGRNLAVVAAISDEEPDVIVITVFDLK
jgi:predicted nucleic acid-binding Zn ribbon protein